jgi:hypothetical protein
MENCNFSGAMTLMGNSYLVDCTTYDEIAFQIEFLDECPYALTVEDRRQIGNAAFQKFVEILNRRKK